MDWKLVLDMIDGATAPDVMTKQEALDAQQELVEELEMRMEELKDEIHQDQIKEKEGD